MKYTALIICLLLTMSGAAAEPPGLENLPAYSIRYDPQRDPFADGHAAIRLAQQTGRRVLIELGGDWCKWCHLMDAFFDNNPDIKTKLHQTFVMLKVNVSDANNNEAFLAAFPRALGYPHMYVAESNGNLLHSKDTAEFVENGRYSRERFMEFFEQWQLRADQPRTEQTMVTNKQ